MMRLLGCVIGLWLVAHAAASQAIEPARTAPVEVKLTADLDGIPLRQVELIRVLIEAAGVIDTLYQAQLAGDGLYPDDMSRAEFEAWRDPRGRSPYTRVRRDPRGRAGGHPVSRGLAGGAGARWRGCWRARPR
jgi:hypothetical protein